MTYESKRNEKEVRFIAKQIKETIGGNISEIMLMSVKLVLELVEKHEIMYNGYDKKYYIPALTKGE